MVGEVRAEPHIRPYRTDPGQDREQGGGLGRQAAQHLGRQRAVETDPFPAGTDQDGARRGALDHRRGLQRRRTAGDIGHIVGRVDLAPHHPRQRFRDEHETAAWQHRKPDAREPGELAAPGTGRIDHVRGMHLTGRRTHPRTEPSAAVSRPVTSSPSRRHTRSPAARSRCAAARAGITCASCG